MNIYAKRVRGAVFEEKVRYQPKPGAPEESGILLANGYGFFGNARIVNKEGKVVMRGRLVLVKSKDRGMKTRLTVFKPRFSTQEIIVAESHLSARNQ